VPLYLLPILLGSTPGYAQDTGLVWMVQAFQEAEKASWPPPQLSAVLRDTSLIVRAGTSRATFRATAQMEPNRFGAWERFESLTSTCAWTLTGEVGPGEAAAVPLEVPSRCDRQEAQLLLVYVDATDADTAWHAFAEGLTTLAWDGTRWAVVTEDPIAERAKLEAAYQSAKTRAERDAAADQLRAFRRKWRLPPLDDPPSPGER